MKKKRRSLPIIGAVAAFAAGCGAHSLRVGEEAPDFTLRSYDGVTVTLSAFQGKKAVVLFFYPKDFTSHCTREACAFRDAYEDFTDAGAVVLGINVDSLESHREFAEKHALPFPLLADEGGKVRRLYGVPSLFGKPGRMTFIIDRAGVIRLAFKALLKPEQHVSESIEMVRRLADDAGAPPPVTE